MGYRFRAVVQLPGQHPDRDSAMRAARRIHGETVVRVVSNLSDREGVEDDSARHRDRRFLEEDE
jgi:hypothetical protein